MKKNTDEMAIELYCAMYGPNKVLQKKYIYIIICCYYVIVIMLYVIVIIIYIYIFTSKYELNDAST